MTIPPEVIAGARACAEEIYGKQYVDWDTETKEYREAWCQAFQAGLRAIKVKSTDWPHAGHIVTTVNAYINHLTGGAER